MTYHSVMTCRFCGKQEWETDEVVKYGVRHYAHHACYLAAGKSLRDLHDWQIVQFPYRLLQEHGLLPEAECASERIAAAAKALGQETT